MNRHVLEARRHGDPQLKFRYSVSLPFEKFPGISNVIAALVSERAFTVSTPFAAEFNPESGPNRNSEWWFIEAIKTPQLAIGFYEHTDQLTLSYFTAWNSLMVDTDGVFLAPKYYKRDVGIAILGPDYTTVLRTIIAHGCAPMVAAPQELAYGSSENWSVDVTFSVDGFETYAGSAQSRAIAKATSRTVTAA